MSFISAPRPTNDRAEGFASVTVAAVLSLFVPLLALAVSLLFPFEDRILAIQRNDVSATRNVFRVEPAENWGGALTVENLKRSFANNVLVEAVARLPTSHNFDTSGWVSLEGNSNVADIRLHVVNLEPAKDGTSVMATLLIDIVYLDPRGVVSLVIAPSSSQITDFGVKSDGVSVTSGHERLGFIPPRVTVLPNSIYLALGLFAWLGVFWIGVAYYSKGRVAYLLQSVLDYAQQNTGEIAEGKDVEEFLDDLYGTWITQHRGFLQSKYLTSKYKVFGSFIKHFGLLAVTRFEVAIDENTKETYILRCYGPFHVRNNPTYRNRHREKWCFLVISKSSAPDEICAWGWERFKSFVGPSDEIKFVFEVGQTSVSIVE